MKKYIISSFYFYGCGNYNPQDAQDNKPQSVQSSASVLQMKPETEILLENYSIKVGCGMKLRLEMSMQNIENSCIKHAQNLFNKNVIHDVEDLFNKYSTHHIENSEYTA